LIEYEKENIEQLVPKRAICNYSGKVIEINDNNFIEDNLIHNFSVSFDYGSPFDGDTWEFDLTEESLINFIKCFKIRPTGFADGAKYPDKVFEEWLETGEYNWRSGWSDEELNEEKVRRETAKEKQKRALEMLRKMQGK
jgi:hypothetical protein